MILIKQPLPPTMGNQYTGSGGSVLAQHSTDTQAIQEIPVLYTLLLYRPPFKVQYETKRSTEALSSPSL